MQIYAEDDHIIFKCDYCHETAIVSGSKNKRQFQMVLNRFYRNHDWACEYRAAQKARIESAKAVASDIIKRVSACS